MDVTNKKQNFNYPQYDMLSLCTELGISPENQPVVDLIPDFKTTLDIVKSKVDLITILLAPGSQNTTGTAQQKRQLKFALADRIFEVSDPFAAYADGKGNDEWYTAFSKTIWVYRSMRPSMLISEADNIISTVTPLLPQLTGTTINQASLTAILDARNAFALFATKPRGKIVSKNSNLTQRVTLLKDAMKLTRRQLDRFATGFYAINQKSFFTEWRRSRKLVPYGTLTTRASVDVYMGDANSPVPGALVKIDNTPFKGTTNDKGHVTISRVPFKTEQFITVTAPGFENPVYAGPFSFKKGKAIHIIINMNEFNIPAPVTVTLSEVEGSNAPA